MYSGFSVLLRSKPTIAGTGGCARAASGHATTALPNSLMNSRRLMASPAPRTKSGIKRLSHFWIENCAVRRTQAGRLMSALGQKQTLKGARIMSALPPKADSCSAAILSLFDHLVGTGKYCRRNGEAECFCGFKIDHQLVLAGRLHR